MTPTPDHIRQLIKEISLSDDQWAFRKFFDHFYPKLVRFAYYFLESGAVSDEIVSSIFLNIWNKRASLHKIERPEAYLFNAVKFKCLNHLRDNRRIQLKDIDSEDFKLIPSLENPEGEYLCNELRQKISNSINHLPPRCKIIFELVKDDGLKYKEVADLLEISVKTVEVQMGRALTKIRQDLMPYLNDEDQKLRKEKAAVNFFSFF